MDIGSYTRTHAERFIMDIHIPNENEAGQLKQEVETLRKNVQEVLAHPGEWVLIQGDHIIGYFKSFADGIADGYKQFGLKQFMVQEIDALTRPPIQLRSNCIPATF